jgi:hypothetical protein
MPISVPPSSSILNTIFEIVCGDNSTTIGDIGLNAYSHSNNADFGKYVEPSFGIAG